MRNIIAFILCLIFPMSFLYPQGIWFGLYLNYIFISFCALLLFFSQLRIRTTFALTFYFRIFILNLFGNLFSYAVGNISFELMVKSSAPIFIAMCTSYIIANIEEHNLDYMKKSIFITFLLVLFLVILDGTLKPYWIYNLFYVKENQLNILDTIFHRAVGPLLSPIMSGFFCATIVIYAFAQIAYKKKIILHSFLFVIGGVGLLLTASRTSMLAVGFVLITYMLFYRVISKKSIFLFVIICITIIVIGDWSFLENISDNLAARNEHLSSGVFEGTGRTDTFISALKYKFDFRCLFWGIGLGEYSVVEDSTFSLAHNGLLSIFLPLGLLGVFLHFYLYRNYLYRYKKFHSGSNLFVSLWILLLLGTFLSADLPVSALNLILQAIILTYIDRINKVNQRKIL